MPDRLPASDDLNHELPRDTPLIARLWHKSVHLSSGCYEWRGLRTTSGYGSITVGGRPVGVHRVAYQEFVGDIPMGLHLDHLCRNRACWNPEHLEPVTSRENTMRSPLALASLNAVKTHCPRGHEYSGDNLRIRRSKTGAVARICLACHRARKRRGNLKQAEARRSK